MSLSRAVFNEFRPFFRMMEDPFSTDPVFSNMNRRDPYNWHSTTPALNLSEENDSYTVEAEVPGVKKENLDIHIGDGGRSLTIEGRVFRGQQNTGGATSPGAAAAPQDTSSSNNAGAASDAMVQQKDSDKQVSTNPAWSGASRTFTRTVWLPHRVDTNSVSATLDHGVLTVKAAKAKDVSVKINVD
jgi:HSP20 family molecular chaperone IbpA